MTDAALPMTTAAERPRRAAGAGETRPAAWWGMVLLVTTEAMVFVGLISAYFFVRAGSSHWPLGGISPPDLARPAAFSVLLIGSSVPIVMAEHAARRDRPRRLQVLLAVAFLMAAAFLANQVLEQRALGFGVRDNVYASLFVLITGLHGLHVLGALVMSAVVQTSSSRSRRRVQRGSSARMRKDHVGQSTRDTLVGVTALIARAGAGTSRGPRRSASARRGP